MGFELITWTLPSGIIVAVSLWLIDISHMSSVFYLFRPSNYAVTAKAMGFELITWTLEFPTGITYDEIWPPFCIC